MDSSRFFARRGQKRFVDAKNSRIYDILSGDYWFILRGPPNIS